MKTSFLFLLFIVMACVSEGEVVTSENRRRWVIQTKPELMRKELDRDEVVSRITGQYNIDGKGEFRKVGSLPNSFVFVEKEGSNTEANNKIIEELKEDDQISKVYLEIPQKRVKKPLEIPAKRVGKPYYRF